MFTIALLFVIAVAVLAVVIAVIGNLIAKRIQEAGQEIARASALTHRPEVVAEDGDTPTISLRLQACERLTLMLERINVANLLLRMPPPAGGTAKEYTAAMLLAIRQEFEHNITQQVYVSDSLWNILLQARDNVSQLIVRAAEGGDTAQQVASRLRLMSSRQPTDPIAMAQSAVRKEATSVLGR